jgi:hypothetical protein
MSRTISWRARALLTAATFPQRLTGSESSAPEGAQPQKYGIDAVADLSDGVGKEANAHEGVEP